jgi:bacteriocin biosynthesis cyclodehydratase domain-containing protein
VTDLPKRPTLCKYLYYVPVGTDMLQIYAGSRVMLLKGKSVTDLLPLLQPYLDGTKELEEIVDALKTRVSERVILDCIRLLYEKGIVEDAPVLSDLEFPLPEQSFYKSQLSYFAHFHSDRFAYQRMLRNSTVAIVQQGTLADTVVPALAVCGVGTIKGMDSSLVTEQDIGASPFLKAEDLDKPRTEVLRDVVARTNPYVHYEGLQKRVDEPSDIESLAQGADLVVFCGNRQAFPLLEWTNAVCLRTSRKWTSGIIDLGGGTVGPSVIPFQTPCYECYRLRSDSNDNDFVHTEAFRDFLRSSPEIQVESPSFFPQGAMVGNLLAAEAVRMLTGYTFPTTLGSILRISFQDWEVRKHEILKIPWCPSCGTLNKRPTEAAFSMEESKDRFEG